MPNALLLSLSKSTGKSVDKLEQLWDKAQEITKKAIHNNEIDQDDETYYKYTVGVLKKMLKMESVELDPVTERIRNRLGGTGG